MCSVRFANQLEAVVGVRRLKRISHAVTKEAAGVRRASHDRGAVLGLIRRDAHRCVFANATPCHNDLGIGMVGVKAEINVARRVLFIAACRVVFDGYIAREIELAVVIDATAEITRPVAGDAAARHSDGAVVFDAATIRTGRVVGDAAALHGEGT